MEDIHIKGYKGVYIIPTVDFCFETGICEIAGESFLEETAKFYSPLVDWIKEFTSIAQKPLILNISLTYFNTITSKWILNILNHIKKFEESGGTTTVNWTYQKDDLDLQDDILDYIEDTGVKINLIPV